MLGRSLRLLTLILMGGTKRSGAALTYFVATISAAWAQSAALVPDDLKFTQDISTRFRMVAWATLEGHDGTPDKFQYDRYPLTGLRPGVERIKRSEGVFVRTSGKSWVRSDDWGATGTPVDENMAAVLDTDVNVVAVPFHSPTNKDSAQGGTVWREAGSAPHGSAIEYTFQESREHPKPDVNYPKYTFLKALGDADGRLFLCGVTANLRDDAGIIPVSMRMAYLVPVPAGTKVQVFDKDTGKEKLNTTTGPDSGWELESHTSKPPAGH
jgi:hypothetical protein